MSGARTMTFRRAGIPSGVLSLLAALAIVMITPPAAALGQAFPPQRFEFAPATDNGGHDAGMRVTIAVPPEFGALHEDRGFRGETEFSNSGGGDKPGLFSAGRWLAPDSPPTIERWLEVMGGALRWPARTVTGPQVECAVTSVWQEGLPASAEYSEIPSYAQYYALCEPLDDPPGVGGLSLSFQLEVPAWTEAFDEVVAEMLRTVELQPVRPLAATASLTGRVAMVGSDHVVVAYAPAGGAGPAIDDRVEFHLSVAGREVSGGSGRVIGADASNVFVAVTDGSPRLGMTAAIAATGAALGGNDGFGFRGAGLAPDGVAGLFEMLLPPNALPHLHERNPESWEADSLWGFHGLSRSADVPAPTGVEPDWEWRALGGWVGNGSLEGASEMAEEFEQRVYCSEQEPCTTRFRGRPVEGATRCVGGSYDVTRDREVIHRRWYWSCDSRGLRYGLEFGRYRAQMQPDDDEVVERMVKSFTPITDAPAGGGAVLELVPTTVGGRLVEILLPRGARVAPMDSIEVFYDWGYAAAFDEPGGARWEIEMEDYGAVERTFDAQAVRTFERFEQGFGGRLTRFWSNRAIDSDPPCRMAKFAYASGSQVWHSLCRLGDREYIITIMVTAGSTQNDLDALAERIVRSFTLLR